MSITKKWIAYGMLGSAFILGTGSLLLFGIFLLFGSFNLVNLGLNNSAILWFDAFLCLVFFVQHSGMVRISFQQRLARLIPSIYGNAIYAISSGFMLFVLMIFWQTSLDIFTSPTGIIRWLFHIVFFLSAIGRAC
jgi:methanethiol S-methyltransferase